MFSNPFHRNGHHIYCTHITDEIEVFGTCFAKHFLVQWIYSVAFRSILLMVSTIVLALPLASHSTTECGGIGSICFIILKRKFDYYCTND